MEQANKRTLKIMGLLWAVFIPSVLLAAAATFSPPKIERPKIESTKTEPAVRFLKTKMSEKEKGSSRCLGSLPSPSARGYVQNYADQFIRKNSKEKSAKLYCALYDGFAYRYTLEVPEEYKSQLPKGAPTSREFLSPVEKCFGQNAKQFCEGQSPHWRENPNYNSEMEEWLLEFSWIHGTSGSPFMNTEDYLRGLGFLMDVLDQKLFAARKSVWIKNKK